MSKRQISIRFTEEQFVLFETVRHGYSALIGQRMSYADVITKVFDEALADHGPEFVDLGITPSTIKPFIVPHE